MVAPQPAASPYSSTVNAIDRDKLNMCLQVLADIESLPPEHPDAVAVRRANAGIFKSVKKARRHAKRDALAAADHAVIAATATGAPGRIDDETQGLPLVSNSVGATAGTLLRSRACYMCKNHYTAVDAFYHQLCPECAVLSHAKRDARTDLTGRKALLTGGWLRSSKVPRCAYRNSPPVSSGQCIGWRVPVVARRRLSAAAWWSRSR